MSIGDRLLDDLRDWVAGPAAGDILDERYELRQRIGEGGMGVVYSAYDRVDGRRVAVKVLRGGSDHDTARFEREVSALTRLEHPAIVRWLAHGTAEGVHYLVMDRLEGFSLAERLRLGRLSVRQTLALARRIGGALAEVHRAGIIHRDIKPSNVFLVGGVPGEDPTQVGVDGASLLDFGIARATTSTTLTAHGALVGTPGYIAPEQVRGTSGPPEPSADVFSLGCILFECLLGRPPFTADTTYSLLARVLLEVAPLVREERPEAPLGLEALVEQMLAKEPKDRPSASEVVRAVSELESALPAGGAVDRVEAAPGLFEGDVIAGKYRVERRLGEGGMGVVIAARHMELGTRVAIKLLGVGSGAAENRSGDEARFLREAQAASRIESEHVVRVLDVGRTGEGRPFIVMEHLRGVDLARRLLEGGALPVEAALDYVIQACDALVEAHALGIVHRDLKPSNLFVVERRDGSEILKVLDFGISKLTCPLEGAALALTATADTAVMGSIAYMAPEQIESSTRADTKSDIWSLGVVLHELLTGRRPFEGDGALAVAARIASASPRPVRELREEIPEAVERAITRCLSREPDRRFAVVGELGKELREARAALRAGGDASARIAAPTPQGPPAEAVPGAATGTVAKGARTPAPAQDGDLPREAAPGIAQPSGGGGIPRWAVMGGVAAAAIGVAVLVFRGRHDDAPGPSTAGNSSTSAAGVERPSASDPAASGPPSSPAAGAPSPSLPPTSTTSAHAESTGSASSSSSGSAARPTRSEDHARDAGAAGKIALTPPADAAARPARPGPPARPVGASSPARDGGAREVDLEDPALVGR